MILISGNQMKRLFVLVVSSTTMIFSAAQKPSISPAAIKVWEKIDGYNRQISSNGKFVIYTTISDEKSTKCLQSINGSWKKEISGALNAIFTEDGQFSIFQVGDSVGIINLNNKNIEYIANAESFKLPAANGEWLAYQLKTDHKPLAVKNLITGEELTFSGVQNYYLNSVGTDLLLIQKNIQDSLYKIQLFNLATKNESNIWTGDEPKNVVFDDSIRRIAFMANESLKGEKQPVIFFYGNGYNKAVSIVDQDLLPSGFSINLNANLQLSHDGKKIFFSIQKANNQSSDSSTPQVQIWNYKDVWLQSVQAERNIGANQTYRSVVNITNRKIIQLEKDVDWGNSIQYPYIGDYVLITTSQNYEDNYWLSSGRPTMKLVSTEDGEETIIKEGLITDVTGFFGNNISPSGKYIFWFDEQGKNYFTYNTVSHQIINVTKNVPFKICNHSDRPDLSIPYGIAGWQKNDNSIIIYDQYDLWQIDPDGKKLPINLTHEFGRKNDIAIKYLKPYDYSPSTPVIDETQKMILVAFNLKNKKNGFYELNVSDKKLVKLSMGPYLYYVNDNELDPGLVETLMTDYPLYARNPLKAKDCNCFLVFREKANESPNLFFTTDFKTFNPLTDLHPEREYNWLTSELIHWLLPTGKRAEALIYKPENFDSLKKYPVIFYFYQRESNALNHFIDPDLNTGPINVPWFVSRGYIVCAVNIYYQTGKTGESVYNAVVSAAKYLSKKKWVDSKHLAFEGHSFGGYEACFLSTQTKLFAAGSAASGITDLVSMYGQLRLMSRNTSYSSFEHGLQRLGCTPWQNLNVYIKNSPIFFADKVQAPLLIMHNKNDEAIPWEQGVEFFTALRRLQKKAWMLQYDLEGHGIFNEENDKLDYTIRLTQFFDHYLKEAPAPVWMTRGIPAKLKQIETGYELDPAGNCGKDCKVCKMWNEKYKKDSASVVKEMHGIENTVNK